MTQEEIRHEIVALTSTMNTISTSKTAVLLSQGALMNEAAYERQGDNLDAYFDAIDEHLALAIHWLHQAIRTLNETNEQ